jgi:hypothetical protein
VAASSFPEEFRRAYGGDLADTTEDVVRDIVGRHGRTGLLVVAPRLLADQILRIAAEHWSDAQRDMGYAVRLLKRSPGFTAAGILCLAIGTGLTAAMYAQVQSTILSDLPGAVRDPGTLVRTDRPVSGPDYEHLHEGAGAHAELAGYVGPVPVTLEFQDRGHRVRVWSHLATPNYSTCLGFGL